MSHNLNVQEADENGKIERTLLIFIIGIYTFMIGLGFLGNSLVIYLFLFNNKLRNVRNAFMLNLTVSNLLHMLYSEAVLLSSYFDRAIRLQELEEL